MPRRRPPLYLLALAMLLGLTGCLTFETIIKVKADGSGTVEQAFVFTNEMLRMAMLFGDDDGGPVELCDEAELAYEAAEMGEGVRLVSAEGVNDDDALGCRVLFAFDDINTLRVSFNPEDQMPAGMTDAAPDDPEAEAPSQAEDYVTFRFEKGRPSTLVAMIKQDSWDDENDQPDAAETDEAALPTDSTQRAQQMQLMREMFKGGRLAIVLDVEGTISETNASFRDGNRITLMEIAFDKFLDDEASLEKLADANPKNADEMKALMKDVEGIKLETNEEVTVRFR